MSTAAITTDAARTVRNADKFDTEFNTLAHAAIGIFLIRTREDTRCKELIFKIAAREETEYHLWQANTGWKQYNTKGVMADDSEDEVQQGMGPHIAHDLATMDPGKAVDYLLEEKRDDGLYVMIAPSHFLDKPYIVQSLKDFSERARSYRQRLVLIVHESAKIPTELEDTFRFMDFMPPSHAELVEVYREFHKNLTEDTPHLSPSFTDVQTTQLIQNAIGMTSKEFEDALSVATIQFNIELDATETGPKPKPNLDKYIGVMLEQKIEIVKRSNILELLPSVSIDEVGGFDILKKWLAERQGAFSDEAKAFGIEPSKGMMCVGPPGTGKSLMAKSAAGMLKIPLIKFDIARVFNKFIGNSEDNMRTALKMVESMAPCVLMLDEVDKGFGSVGGGGDSGVSDRVFGTFLTWMQERTTKKDAPPVFVVMTANRVQGLPPELMRKGRLDEVFACTFPSAGERSEILAIHLKKRGHKLPKADLQKLALSTNNFVGSELEAIIKDGLLTCFNDHGRQLKIEVFMQKAAETKTLYETFKEQVRSMNDWAKNNAKAASSGMSFDNPELGPTTPAATAPRRNLTMRKPGGPVKAHKAIDQ